MASAASSGVPVASAESPASSSESSAAASGGVVRRCGLGRRVSSRARRADLPAEEDGAQAHDQHDDAEGVEQALAALHPPEHAGELHRPNGFEGGAAIASPLLAPLPSPASPLVAHEGLPSLASRSAAAASSSGLVLFM